ncbi:MAG: hypothetical protein WD625_03860 [Balneolales bacterium]
MKQEFKAEEAELFFTTGTWEEVEISDTEKLFKPRYLHKNCDWQNVDQLKLEKLPFLYVKYVAHKIAFIEAQSGIVREVPVFYTYKSGKILISDSPDNFIKFMDNLKINELSVQEFLSFGYVTSDRTLLSGIHSIQAGESLRFDGERVKIDPEYIYNITEISSKPREFLFQDFNKITESVFHELIKSLQGKKAIVPLSGGYDSRFIVSMLKMGGFDNVDCYAWGVKGDKEIEVSRSIAQKLGYKWQAIDYSKESWLKVTRSEWFRDCMRFVSKFTSIAGSASLPFLDYMRNTAGHDDYVLLPGHAPVSRKVIAPNQDALESIFNTNFFGNSIDHRYGKDLISEIGRQVKEYSSLLTDDYRSFELWNWRERQSKFLVNSNRYYEFLDYSWNMPFWSVDYVDFWSAVPLEEKHDLKLYDDFLESFVFKELDLQYDLDRTRKSKQAKTFSIQYYLRLLRKYRLYRKLSLQIRSKIISNPYGFDYAFPELYNKIATEFTEGFPKVEHYKKQFGIEKSHNPYAYLSQFTLAMLSEDVEK